jgi:hypothetical protein
VIIFESPNTFLQKEVNINVHFVSGPRSIVEFLTVHEWHVLIVGGKNQRVCHIISCFTKMKKSFDIVLGVSNSQAIRFLWITLFQKFQDKARVIFAMNVIEPRKNAANVQ